MLSEMRATVEISDTNGINGKAIIPIWSHFLAAEKTTAFVEKLLQSVAYQTGIPSRELIRFSRIEGLPDPLDYPIVWTPASLVPVYFDWLL